MKWAHDCLKLTALALLPMNGYPQFPDDWRRLSAIARREVCLLLTELQANPYNQEILAHCQVDQNEVYGYRLDSGCAIYWRVLSEPLWNESKGHALERPALIELTAILGVPYNPAMEDKDDEVLIRAYREFWDEFSNFPTEVQDEVAQLLRDLQKNPYSPEIITSCQIDGNDRFAYKLRCGYVVYWRIETKAGSDRADHVTSFRNMQIELLAILRHKKSGK